MKKRWYITLSVALVGALAFAWLSRRPPEQPVYQGRTVTEWARDLNSLYPEVRSNATLALRAVGTNGIPSLLQALERRDPAIKKPFLSLAPKLPVWLRRSFMRRFNPFNASRDRLAAVTGLSALGTNAPVRPLINALRDPDQPVVAQAATALAGIGKAAVPDLIRALNDSDVHVRSMACYALSMMSFAPAEAAPALIERLTDSVIGEQVLYALGRIGRAAIPSLMESLKHPDERVRAQAARALGGMRPPAKECAPALIAATKDPHWAVRTRAVEALGNVWPSSPEVIAALAAALKDENVDVRAKAAQALAGANGIAAAQVLGGAGPVPKSDARPSSGKLDMKSVQPEAQETLKKTGTNPAADAQPK